MSRAVMCSLNFPVLVNFPRQVPRERRFGRAIEVARLAIERRR